MSGRNAKAMKEGFAAQDDANSAVTTIKQDKNNVDQARIQAEQEARRIQQEKDAADQARIQAEQEARRIQQEKDAVDQARIQAEQEAVRVQQEKDAVDQARIQAEQKAVRIQQEKDAADQARIQAEQKLQQLQGSNSPTGSDDSQCKIDLGHNLIIKQKLLSKPVTQAMLGMVCNADKTPKDGGTLTVDELRDEGVDIVGECGGLA